MKILFFIGRRQLDTYSYSAIKDRQQYILIAIVAENDLKSIPESIKANFAAIYGTSCSNNFLAEFDFEQVYDIIQQEIANYPAGAQIAIICQDEANVLLAAKLRSSLNLNTGAKHEEVLAFRNKLLMKTILDQHNIRIPRHLPIDKTASFNSIVSYVGLPFIIKPIDSAGSFGIYKISQPLDFDKFMATNALNQLQYEAEEFIEGILYHCDSAVKNKQLLFMECSVYTCPNLDFQKGKTLGSIVLMNDEQPRNELLNFARRALEILGMPDGTHHMEIFQKQNGELVFLEVAARAPGFIVSQMYEKTFGRNPVDIDLFIQADVSLASTTKKLAPAFWAIFPITEGIVKSLLPPPIKSQCEISWTVKPGEHTKACQSNVDIGGILLAYNEDYQILKEDFQTISKHQAILY